MGPDDVRHLGADGENRIEAGHGLLENHGYVPSPHFYHTFPTKPQKLPPAEADGAVQLCLASAGEESGNGKGGHGFSAARLTYQAHDFPLPHLQVHIMEDGNHALLGRKG